MEERENINMPIFFSFVVKKKSALESLAMLRLIGSMGNFGTKFRQPGSSLCSIPGSLTLEKFSTKYFLQNIVSLKFSNMFVFYIKFTFL